MVRWWDLNFVKNISHDRTYHRWQVALKLKQASKELLETHYEDLKAKPFFPGLIQYMSSGPVVPMVRRTIVRLCVQGCWSRVHNILYHGPRARAVGAAVAKGHTLALWLRRGAEWAPGPAGTSDIKSRVRGIAPVIAISTAVQLRLCRWPHGYPQLVLGGVGRMRV